MTGTCETHFVPGNKIRYAAIEPQKGKPGHRGMLKPKFCYGQVSLPNHKEGWLKMEWESDSLIVLGAWESHVQGEGADKTA